MRNHAHHNNRRPGVAVGLRSWSFPKQLGLAQMLTVPVHAAQLREVLQAVDARGMFRRAADAAALAEREVVLGDRARAAAPAACCGPGASEGAEPGAAGSAAGAEIAAACSSGAQAAARLPRPASAAEPAAHAANGGSRHSAAPANGRASRGAANAGGAGHAVGQLATGDDDSDDGEVSAPQSDEEGLVSAAADTEGVSLALAEAGGSGRDESPPPPPPADSAGPSPASGGGDQGPRADSGGPGARRPLPQSEDEAYARICEALAATDARLARLHAALQPNALLLVLGCQGDTFEVRRLQARRCYPPSWLLH